MEELLASILRKRSALPESSRTAPVHRSGTDLKIWQDGVAVYIKEFKVFVHDLKRVSDLHIPKKPA